MNEYLFKRNLWTVDFVTSILFAIYFSYRINLIADSPVYHEQRNLVIGVLAYILIIVLAFFMQKKFDYLPSWIWLGVFGALIRILILVAINFPNQLNYHLRFSPLGKGVFAIIYDLIATIFFNWLIWAIVGLLCIFTVRIILYIFKTFFFFFSEYSERSK